MRNILEDFDFRGLGKDLGLAALGLTFIAGVINKATEQEKIDEAVEKYLDNRYPRKDEDEES